MLVATCFMPLSLLWGAFLRHSHQPFYSVMWAAKHMAGGAFLLYWVMYVIPFALRDAREQKAAKKRAMEAAAKRDEGAL